MRMDWLRTAGLATAGVLGLALGLGATGCKSNTAAPSTDSSAAGGDPADVNLAPAQVLSAGSSSPQSSSGESYPEQSGQYAPTDPGQQTGAVYDTAYDQDQAQVDAGEQALYADQPPPPLPEYEQPELTEPGYIWTPGYWSYAPTGYYWVPGAWVAPPTAGFLWTPGYWGYVGSRYQFHWGFWGPHIGFYGGINYGFGYTGVGYHGGYWNHDHFYYNTQVNRVNVSVVKNVYVHNVTVVNNTRVSYNGPRGVAARPTAAEVAVYHERVVPAMHVQIQSAQAAAGNRQQFYTENHGRPAAVVAPERLAADRTPPAALRPAPAVVRMAEPGARPGTGPGTPAAPGRVEPVRVDAGQQAREQQAQKEQQQEAQKQQQIHQQQGAQRQQEVTREDQRQPQPAPARPAAPAARPEAAPQPRPAPAPATRPAPAPRPEAAPPRPAPESRPAPAPRPAPESHPAPAPAPRPAPAPSARPAPPAAHPAPPAPHPPERPPNG